MRSNTMAASFGWGAVDFGHHSTFGAASGSWPVQMSNLQDLGGEALDR
jgi:hypothetical protein